MDGARSIETVVIEVDVERPQRPIHDIRYKETIAVEFATEDTWYPEVLALRSDFPQAPHENLRKTEIPRSLCLYEQPWAEVALRWTPASFVERIRYWLRETARGALHGTDQPLEPLLFGSGYRIILAPGLLNDLSSEGIAPLKVRLAAPVSDCMTLVAEPLRDEPSSLDSLKYIATPLQAKPQRHGLIRCTPRSLADLHTFLLPAGIDLIDTLRNRLRGWTNIGVLDVKLMLVIGLPLLRDGAGSPERSDFWVFVTGQPVRGIGKAIGLWDEHDGNIGLLAGADESQRGDTVTLDIVSPVQALSRDGAAQTNSRSGDPCKVLAVGAGALGSQVIDELARKGFGQWTIVDQDDLLPHNLARHALGGDFVGYPKALAMQLHLNALYTDGNGAKGIVADVLSPGNAKNALADAAGTTDLILDIAASVPVARHLAIDMQSNARRISVFLNSHGTDVVVIAEDRAREMRLDVLEQQYYRAVASDSRLAGHLANNPERVRYGRSCRDVSMPMRTHIVTLLSAVASEAISRAHSIEEASIHLFRCNPVDLSVTSVSVPVSRASRFDQFTWSLSIDHTLLNRIAELREAKLPKETGGVLLGSYDFSRKLLYVVDTVPSPPDSKEWPNLYIRGSEGLLAEVIRISEATGGQIEYIGEWHSHPQNCPTLPSDDDLKGFAWLTERMNESSQPALIAIAGDGPSSSWYLGQMMSSGEGRVIA